MVIGINMIFYSKENGSAYMAAVFEAFIARHPEHTFLLLFSGQPLIKSAANIILFDAGPSPQNAVKWNIWSLLKIKKALRLHRFSILVNSGENLLIPTKLTQIIFNPSLSITKEMEVLSKSAKRLYRRFTPVAYKKVSLFIVVSYTERAILMQNYEVPESRIKVIPAGTDPHAILPGWEEREQIKEKFAKGYEYFLYSGYIGTAANLLNLLKGFSAFKKRQKSNMQLLITGRKGVNFTTFNNALQLYRYKDDVHIIPFEGEEQEQEIISAAYAMVYPLPSDNRAGHLLLSLSYGVPALVPENSTLSEAGEKAVLTADTRNSTDIAAKMILIFKDEKLRSELIAYSKGLIKKRSKDHYLHELSEYLLKLPHSG